jgi:beta-glucosidase
MVTATVTNTGSLSGEEVPQLYIHHISPVVVRPLKELRGFTRIHLQPGESKIVTFWLPYEDLTYYDELTRTFVVDNGSVEIMIGSSSEDIRLIDRIDVQGSTVSGTYRQDALSRIEAENFEKKSKPVTIIAGNEGSRSVNTMTDDDYLVFKNVDFGSGVNRFDANIKLASKLIREGFMEIILDSLNGPVAGMMIFAAGTGEVGYQVKTCAISGARGLHDLFLVFRDVGKGFCSADWFRFRKDVTIQDSNQYNIVLFPNPASLNFQLMFECSFNTAISIEIFTLEGVMLKSLDQKARNNGLNILYFNAVDLGLSQGMYIIKCRIGDDSKSLKLFIVQ